MTSADLLQAGWVDITGLFVERDRYLELAKHGKAIVRRLRNGWFAKSISAHGSENGASADRTITGANTTQKGIH